MSQRFTLVWTHEAAATFHDLQEAALRSQATRSKTDKKKSSKQEGLFKQVVKCLSLLEANPRHPGLKTHEFTSIEHPYKKGEKVFEAYVQNRTPGAYRVFWCYGPDKSELTIMAITPHP